VFSSFSFSFCICGFQVDVGGGRAVFRRWNIGGCVVETSGNAWEVEKGADVDEKGGTIWGANMEERDVGRVVVADVGII
jgi:hypothetical protein